MTFSQFRSVKIVIAFVLAMTVSVSITQRNAIIPIIVTLIALIALLLLRTRVNEVIADERDREISGRAAWFAIQLYSVLSLIPILYLFAMRDQNPFYEPVASALAYSVTFLMIAYSGIFYFYNRLPAMTKKTPYVILIAFVLGFLVLIGVRMFSGEDTWICENGQWTKHGNPSFAAPTVPCR